MKTRHHQRICLQVFRIVQDLVKLGSWMAFKELDSNLWVFAIFTATGLASGSMWRRRTGSPPRGGGGLVPDQCCSLPLHLCAVGVRGWGLNPGHVGGLVSEGHRGRFQVDWSVVGHLHLEQDVSLGEEDDQLLVVVGQVPFVLQVVSWTTKENCLKN